ncbi:MAG: LON peptidase substrate-binding domain-containing protein [Candidatus Eremiobacteraeota bacterium]|nr:LON peptidase substrate-binding domain-containing protein [Candidatus Eremiobacteraeota bacterium]
MAVRNGVFFPGSASILSVGRATSMAALRAAAAAPDKTIVLLTQKKPEVEEPGLDDLHWLGVRAIVHRFTERENGLEVVVEGRDRVRLFDLGWQPFPVAQVQLLGGPTGEGEVEEELHEELLEQSSRLFELAGQAGDTAARLAADLDNPDELVCFLASALSLSTEEGMAVLGAERLQDAQRLTLEYLHDRIERMEDGDEFSASLVWPPYNEDEPDESPSLELLRSRLAEMELPVDILLAVGQELEKLERLESDSVDYQNVLTGLELYLELPWSVRTEDNLDLDTFGQALDEQLYGLENIKQRLLDRLSWMRLAGSRPPVLCLVGPSGSGKTAVAQALAAALGRQFEAISLDHADPGAVLQGTVWTQPGAAIGQLFQALRRAQTINPVLALESEQLDRLMAESVLSLGERPREEYLGLPLDLSEALLVVTTCSIEGLPQRLRDRFEVLYLVGYDPDEKRELARRHLLPRQLRSAGLEPSTVELSEPALEWLLKAHTDEPGMAQCQRLLREVAARLARRRVESETEHLIVEQAQLQEWFGPGRPVEPGLPRPGRVRALAMTTGGAAAVAIEALRLPEEELVLTGPDSQGLRDQVSLARSLLLARRASLGVSSSKAGLHLHLPEAVLATDYAHCRLALTVVSLSACLDLSTDPRVGLLGGVSLAGQLEWCDHLEEKLLAARRAGLERVVLPAANQAELHRLPAALREGLQLIAVETLEEAVAVAIPALAAKLTADREATFFDSFRN